MKIRGRVMELAACQYVPGLSTKQDLETSKAALLKNIENIGTKNIVAADKKVKILLPNSDQLAIPQTNLQFRAANLLTNAQNFKAWASLIPFELKKQEPLESMENKITANPGCASPEAYNLVQALKDQGVTVPREKLKKFLHRLQSTYHYRLCNGVKQKYVDAFIEACKDLGFSGSTELDVITNLIWNKVLDNPTGDEIKVIDQVYESLLNDTKVPTELREKFSKISETNLKNAIKGAMDLRFMTNPSGAIRQDYMYDLYTYAEDLDIPVLLKEPVVNVLNFATLQIPKKSANKSKISQTISLVFNKEGNIFFVEEGGSIVEDQQNFEKYLNFIKNSLVFDKISDEANHLDGHIIFSSNKQDIFNLVKQLEKTVASVKPNLAKQN